MQKVLILNFVSAKILQKKMILRNNIKNYISDTAFICPCSSRECHIKVVSEIIGASKPKPPSKEITNRTGERL